MRATRRTAHIGTLAMSVALLTVAAAIAASTPKAATAKKPAVTPTAVTVTDANVAERVIAARTADDQKALAAYYRAKAAAQDEPIAHFERLYRAYEKLEGKQLEPLQRQARLLLKAARMLKQRYDLLAQAHLNLAWEVY